MLWLGLVLLVAGVGGYLYAHHLRRHVHALIATETQPVAELETYRGAAAEVATSVRRVAEVLGHAEPGPHGPLVSELSRTECVWHRHLVRRRYRKVSTDSRGRRKVSEHTETVAENSSGPLFGVRDGSGLVYVDPAGARPDAPELVMQRFEPAEQAPQGFLDQLLGPSRQAGTIGYEYNEWVLRPGARLFVHGLLADRGQGPLVFGRPAKGPYVISTRSEAEVRVAKSHDQLMFAFGSLAVFLIGLALVVVKLVS
ncbi:GIDE domain-containing protein [Crossiella sp. NPDC003009]